jgi:hypothetical protein
MRVWEACTCLKAGTRKWLLGMRQSAFDLKAFPSWKRLLTSYGFYIEFYLQLRDDNTKHVLM